MVGSAARELFPLSFFGVLLVLILLIFLMLALKCWGLGLAVLYYHFFFSFVIYLTFLYLVRDKEHESWFLPITPALFYQKKKRAIQLVGLVILLLTILLFQVCLYLLTNRYFYCSVASGAIIILIGIAARWFDSSTKRNNYWLRISNYHKQKSRFPMLFHLQVSNWNLFLRSWILYVEFIWVSGSLWHLNLMDLLC